MRVITTTPPFLSFPPPWPLERHRSWRSRGSIKTPNIRVESCGLPRTGNTVSYLAQLPRVSFKGFSRWRRLCIDSSPLRETTIAEFISTGLQFLHFQNSLLSSRTWKKFSKLVPIVNPIKMYRLRAHAHEYWNKKILVRIDQTWTKLARNPRIIDESWQPALAAVETSTET